LFSLDAELFNYFNSTPKLEIYDSNIEFEYNHGLINENCTDDANLKPTLFQNFDSINIFFNYHLQTDFEFCSLIFKNINISKLELNFVTEKIKFKTPSNLIDLDSSITEFKIDYYFYSQYLDNETLDLNVFKYLKKLTVSESLDGIQNDLFKSFKYLKKFEVDLINFSEFIKGDISWMNYLNADVHVDLNNQTDVDLNKENYFVLVLDDMRESYEYSDEDFCHFQDFPHSKLVLPIIQTGAHIIGCSCTLLFLMQYHRFYPDNILSFDELACIQHNDFDELVRNCTFDTRLRECRKESDLFKKCKLNETSIFCNNFDSLKELDFYGLKNQTFFKSIKLKPTNTIILNDELDFGGLYIDKKFTIEFNNLNGIQINKLPNITLDRANIEGSQFIIDNSSLFFYYDDKLINYSLCNSNDFKQDYKLKPIYISLLKFGTQITYPDGDYPNNGICPFVFNNAYINTLEVSSEFDVSYINFYDIAYEDLNCTIKQLRLNIFHIYLSKYLLNKNIFEKLEALFIENNSKLTTIEYDVFKYLKYLKHIKFEIVNFDEFIRNENNNQNEWMAYLNINVNVNLNDANEIGSNINKKLYIELEDAKSEYAYPESDFCLFKNFPHSKLVFPIIKTKKDLSCTCTLLWLIKNYKLILNDIDIISTPSVKSCLNNISMESMCDFEQKISKCNNINITTSTIFSLDSTLTSTSLISSTHIQTKSSDEIGANSNNNEAKMLTGFLIGVSGLAILLTIGLVFALVKLKKRKSYYFKEEEIGITNLNFDE
jgi:hypothetical protein